MAAIPESFFIPLTTVRDVSTTPPNSNACSTTRPCWRRAASSSMTPNAMGCCAKPPPR